VGSGSTNMASGVLLLLAAVASLTACSAYYLPGTYPQEFLKGQKLRGANDRTAATPRPRSDPRRTRR